MVSIIDTEKQKRKIKVVNEIIKILSDEDKEKDKKTDELSEIKKEIERLKQAEQDKHKND